MYRLALTVLALVTLPAGMTRAQSCDGQGEIAAAVSAAPVRVEGKENLARSAYACGHFWSAANLQEKSVSENGNALERFNLASAYARTGQYARAEALYQSVIEDGLYLNVRMDTAATEIGARPAGFNLAEEAARRRTGLIYLRTLMNRQSASAPRSALDAGVNATSLDGPGSIPAPSAVSDQTLGERVGLGIAGAYGVDAVDISGVAPVSDQEALQRDGLLPATSVTPTP